MELSKVRVAVRVLAVGWCGLAAGAGQGQALVQQVPADAVFYAGWAGSEAVGDAYAQSTLRELVTLIEPQRLGEAYRKALPMIQHAVGDPEAGEAIRQVTELLAVSGRNPTAVYVTPGDEGIESWGLGLMWQPVDAADRQTLLSGIKWVQDAAADLPMRLVTDGPTVKLLIDQANPPAPPAAADALPAGVGVADAAGLAGSSLARLPRFFEAIERLEGAGPLVMYVDTLAMADEVVAMLAEEATSPGEAESVARVVEVLGLRELGPVVFKAGFDGRAWQSRSFTGLPAERSGVSSLLESPSLTMQDLAVAPPSAVWVAVQSLDVGLLVDLARATAGAVGPEAAAGFEQTLADASGVLAMDVEARLLRGLGSSWAMYLDPEALGDSLAGLTVVNPLRDAEGVERGLRVIGAWATVALQRSLSDAAVRLQVQTQTYEGLDVHTLLLPMVAPSWAVAEGKLLVGLYPQVVLAARDRLAQGGSIADRPELRELEQIIGTRRLTGVSWVDLPRTAESTYGGLVGGETLLTGLTAMATGQPMPRVLPTLGKLRPLLSPAYRISWVDQRGWHTLNHAPFPGSSALAPQALGAVATMPLTGSMLPAMLMGSLRAAEVE